MSSILLWTIVGLLLFFGLFGTIIPALPGIGFVFAGILIYALVTGFEAISVTTVVILGAIALLALVIDYGGSAVGARVGGGKAYAFFGAILGAVIGGLLSGPPGIFIGSFAGSLAGALIEGQTREQALKVAFLSMIGVIGAGVMQFLLAAMMIIGFFIAVFT